MSTKKFSRNKQEKIDLIYKTFFNLILKRGYHKVSTNHVAKSAMISIGTIYKYFPKGKEDIIRKYFDESMKDFFNREDVINMDRENIREFLHHFISELFQIHIQNKGYIIAFRSAIQSDKKLLESYIERIFIFFKDIAYKLRNANENFKEFPEERVVESFIFIYNLINAIIFQHLTIMELLKGDDKFVDYLTDLVVFSLKYLLKN